jgi:uncharacterized protein YceK
MKKIAILLMFFIPLFLSGCGAIRNLKNEYGYPYGGLKGAAWPIYSKPCNVDSACLLYYPQIIIYSPFIISDILLSSIVDTVTYPISKSKETENINRTVSVLGKYIHDENNCFVSVSIVKDGNEYRNNTERKSSQISTIEVFQNSSSGSNSCNHIIQGNCCEAGKHHWEFGKNENDEAIIIGGRRFTLVKDNENVTGLTSINEHIFSKEIVKFQKQ